MSQVDQAAVTGLFEADAANWDSYYERSDVFSVIHQLRRSLALALVDELGLKAGAQALEVGCGTGLFAIELARRGLRVTAVDAAANMLARAEVNVAAAGLGESVTLRCAPAESLPFPSGSMRLVVALGLVPWLLRPEAALAEMARTLVEGGHLIVNCDNSRRLPVLLDPRYSPATRRARAALRAVRGRSEAASFGSAAPSRQSPAEFDQLLAQVGLRVERGQTFGFGPFTLGGREVLPRAVGVALHQGLQRLADSGVPPARSTGAQYIVRAGRP